MIVVDDYSEGRIYAGHTVHDLEGRVPDSMFIKAKMHHENLDEPVHIHDNYGADYYIMKISHSDLFNYMSSRDCTNFVMGV
jgi:hypothetical protein